MNNQNKAYCVAYRLFTVCYLFLSIALSTQAIAEGWQGQGEIGYIKSNGNTDSENLNLGLNFSNEGKVWSNQFGFSIYKSSNDNLEQANNVDAEYTLKRVLTKRSNLFLSLSYIDDKFDGFEQQSSISLGYGYKFFDSEALRWETGFGVGYRNADEIPIMPTPGDSVAPARGLTVSGTTLVFRSELESPLSSNTDFIWDFRSEMGSKNSFLHSDMAIQVSMSERFSLKAQVIVRHNTDPASDADGTDTVSLLSLVYTLGK